MILNMQSINTTGASAECKTYWGHLSNIAIDRVAVTVPESIQLSKIVLLNLSCSAIGGNASSGLTIDKYYLLNVSLIPTSSNKWDWIDGVFICRQSSGINVSISGQSNTWYIAWSDRTVTFYANPNFSATNYVYNHTYMYGWNSSIYYYA